MSVTAWAWVNAAWTHRAAPSGPPPPTDPTRMQAATATSDATTTVAVSFATLPSVGHGVVVAVFSNRSGGFGASACTDNQGHAAYTRATWGVDALGNQNSVTIYYLPIIATSSGTFTVTIAPGLGSIDFAVTAIEVGGVGSGLAEDRSSSDGATGGISATPVAQTVLAGTVDHVFAVAGMAIAATQGSITCGVGGGVASPAWTLEQTVLPLGPVMAGQIVSRALTTATSVVCTAAWTCSASGWWSCAIATFRKT